MNQGQRRQDIALSSLNFRDTVLTERQFDIKGESFFEAFEGRKTWVKCEGTWDVRRYQFYDRLMYRALCCLTKCLVCCECAGSRPKTMYQITLRHQRYSWKITKSFSEVKTLLRKVRYLKTLGLSSAERKMLKLPSEMMEYFRQFVCCDNRKERIITERAHNITRVLQYIVDTEKLWEDDSVKKFLEVGPRSFDPFFGEKGVECYLSKSSGGYTAGYSRTCGDYFTVRQNRWIVFTPSQIVWYRSHLDPNMLGTLKVTPETMFYLTDHRSFMSGEAQTRMCLSICTDTRIINLKCTDRTSADILLLRVLDFYNRANANSRQFQEQSRVLGSFPARIMCDVRLYHVPRDYFSAAAVALLSAKKEIYIASWKNTPRIHLTRPPLPPLRLDQILAYKASQGVKVYIILYKEVEMSGQGNDSGLAQSYLEALSPLGNIHVLRHPNKLIGGSTAIMWSHHEKLTIVDRNLAFVGGIDMAVGRWDDDIKGLDDEDGLKYPGKDYRQPAEKMYPPAKPEVPRLVEPKLEGQSEGMVANVMSMVTNRVKTPSMDNSGGDTIPSPGAPTSLSADEGPSFAAASPPRPISTATATTASAEQSRKSGITRGTRGRSSTSKMFALSEGREGASSGWETRDLYPRSGWHDVHSSVSGLAARDVANHFVERWNHHRISTGENVKSSMPMLVYSDDNPSFGLCAKCGRAGIDELCGKCPTCNHDLGSVCPLLLPPRPAQMPLPFSPHFKGDYTEDQGPKAGMPTDRGELSAQDQHALRALSSARAKASLRSYIEFSFELHSGFSCPVYGSCPTMVVDATEQQGRRMRLYGRTAQSPEKDEAPLPAYLGESTVLRFTRDGDDGSSEFGAANGASIFNTEGRGTGTLITENSHGRQAAVLLDRGLTPQLGDCLVSINGADVSHLDHKTLGRFFYRVAGGWSEYSRAASEEEQEQEEGERNNQGTEQDTEPGRDKGKRRSSFMSRNSAYEDTRVRLVFRRHFVESFADREDRDSIALASASVTASASASASAAGGKDKGRLDTEALRERQYRTQIESSEMACRADITLVSSSQSMFAPLFDADNVAGALGQTISSLFKNKCAFGPNSVEYRKYLYLVQSAGREVSFRMSQVYSHCGVRAWLAASFPTLLLPHSPRSQSQKMPLVARNVNNSGTCRVQVLRSVGTWSLGVSQPETSILRGWIDAINNAEHFIYIENQFFISNNKFSDTKGKNEIPENSITAALLSRLVSAWHNKENFKVIVIIPQHPQGDVAYSMRPRSILHYQAETIDKGVNCLFSRLKSMCPGVDPKRYINFYCLQNYGIINDRFMHDQIYVHDKLCIVDDRVMIVGSANINDRSMLGDRDTEMALHIVDRKEVTITVGGRQVNVGATPHEARVRLMRMHLGDKKEELDVDDILSSTVFDDLWDATANTNASLYSAIDGHKDIYGEHAKTLSSYKAALEVYENPSVYDDEVETAIESLKGFLIPYPHSFLSEEDLRPNLALRGIIPERLWV